MSELSDFDFETISEGSELAGLLCAFVLEPRADWLIDASFKEFPAATVTNTLDVRLIDDTVVNLEFRADKCGIREDDHEIVTQYAITITFERPRK